MVVFQLVHSIFNRVSKIEQIKGLLIAVLGNHHLRRLLAQNRASIRRKIDVLTESTSPLSAKNWEAEKNA